MSKSVCFLQDDYLKGISSLKSQTSTNFPIKYGTYFFSNFRTLLDSLLSPILWDDVDVGVDTLAVDWPLRDSLALKIMISFYRLDDSNN